jgi:hypothetical protein
MGEFHLCEGFTYERVSDSGDVRLRVRDHHGGEEVVREVTVPENEWASVVASVSAKGEDGDTYQAARDLHAGRIVPGEIHSDKTGF